jgi:hypothetical protein
MQYLILALLSLVTYSTATPPKCLEYAPYNVFKTTTALAVDKAVREGTSWYEYRLATLSENTKTLPPSEVDQAVDHFMEVFCPEPWFEGFVGITGDGHVFTNKSDVRALYKAHALRAGVVYPFNVNAYNQIISIQPESTLLRVYANITSFNQHVIRTTGADGNDICLLVLGHYQNKWMIGPLGDLCIAGFTDAFLDILQYNCTALLSGPWNLDI